MKPTLLSEKDNLNGIWFFGLAGSGKTFASKVCAKFIRRPFIIDGDDVREFISFDLGYSSSDRIIQVTRVLGILEIARKNYQFPIASTVTMTEAVFQKCNLLGVEVVEIIRPMAQLHKVRDIYEKSQNVVGKQIPQIEIEAKRLLNNGDKEFEEKLEAFIK